MAQGPMICPAGVAAAPMTLMILVVLLSPVLFQLVFGWEEKVTAAVRASNADVGGRVLEMSGSEYVVRGRGRFSTLDDLRMSPQKEPARIVAGHVKTLSDNKLSDRASDEHATKAATKAATMFNTNRSYVNDAKRLKADNPEAFAQVKSGHSRSLAGDPRHPIADCKYQLVLAPQTAYASACAFA